MSDGTASNAKLNVDTSPLESTGTLTNPYSNCETYRGCGPTHLTGHHPSPLGHSEMHSHYIKPVPPMYVTEYEAAYNDPRFANDNFNLSPKSSMSSGQESRYIHELSFKTFTRPRAIFIIYYHMSLTLFK
jgi:hypothetical protein